MKLLDARRLAVQQGIRVRFQLSDGRECAITEHGIAQVPQLDGPPGFNLEAEFAKAGRFVLEPVTGPKEKARSRVVSREELEALAAPATGKPEEHEE